MKNPFLAPLWASAFLAGLTLVSHAATADSATSNIFSGETVFASTIYDSDFKLAGAVDGVATPALFASEFVFEDNVAAPGLLSISGFTASAGIGSITFFGTGEYGADRAATSVIIYTSTTDYSSSSTHALATGNYTALNGGTPFTLATNADSSDFSEGTDSAGSGQGFDTLTGLDIPTGTESILFSFTRPGGPGPGFSEIQGFAVPEPSTWLLLGAGAMGLLLVRRRFQRPA